MFVFVCTVHFMVEFVQTFRMHSMWMLLLCLVSNRKKKVFDVKLHDFFVRVIIGRMQQRRYNQKIDASALYRLILPKDNMKQSIRVHNIQKKHTLPMYAQDTVFFSLLFMAYNLVKFLLIFAAATIFRANAFSTTGS